MSEIYKDGKDCLFILEYDEVCTKERVEKRTGFVDDCNEASKKAIERYNADVDSPNECQDNEPPEIAYRITILDCGALS